ncbi:tryptophan dimethylallyltransferase family protein [Actinokineospora auranticolor]|uniref:DMATS type aromatic prenyltransferase n=1 Tax=Actinokineospora auranticolor TaxID=155976 RepID=A0A2S6H016_9PSEU|nr:tryptophan dimethylallyltransferase family protein [Actinokineospora auranticolor]PPK70842.1 DMATS type aromatic prenyltransferase [Actinokineospora auranticolor]
MKRAISVNDHTGAQVRRLCAAAGLTERADEVVELLADLLGPAGQRGIDRPPAWRSDVADDHCPVEYSLAFEEDGSTTLRLLVESTARRPGPRANMNAGLRSLERLARRYPLSLDRFDAVRDLFLPAAPVGAFSLWFSVVVTAAAVRVKVYLNPEVSGRAVASGLVRAGLDRLGFTGAYAHLRAHAARQESCLDTYSFFALDLDDTPRSRVKVYQTHRHAGLAEVRRLASAFPDADPVEVVEFAAILGEVETFRGRPLVSSTTFLSGSQARPDGFSLYVPIRDYVPDDAAALERTACVLDKHGHDTDLLRAAVRAVTDRPLGSGTGLVAHVSLRLGRPRSGVTVYLSAEAHGVTAPRASAA